MCEHCCNHSHKDENVDNIKRIAIAFIFFILSLFFKNTITGLVLSLIAYIISGNDVLLKAIKNIKNGKVFDENFLMSIATIGAFSINEWSEAVAVMLLYQIGELLQDKAVDKTRESITDLMDLKVEFANVVKEDKIEKVKPENVYINDIIVVKVGEKVPLDGIIIDGVSSVDTSSLTGESVPKSVKVGDEILSGCINFFSILKIKVTKNFENSAVSKILELVEHAQNAKSKTENFITKFAKIYTPCVVVGALLVVLIPLVLGGTHNINIWIERALTFLVISCPCALVISVPLTFFCGIGKAAKFGILIKGSNYIEMLSKVSTIAFDKTGTLTKGVFKVTEIINSEVTTKEELLKLAASSEVFSNHPVAISLRNEYAQSINTYEITDVTELAGLGLSAKVKGDEVLIGNIKLMQKFNIEVSPILKSGTIIYVAKDNIYQGAIIISDVIKENSAKTIKELKQIGCKTVMLTGDTDKTASEVSKELSIDEYFANLLPAEKVSKIEYLINKKKPNTAVLFTGDGINDAPVLMRSDVGIAMGALGSDSAIEASDVVITDDDILKIPLAIKISKQTIEIAKQNITFSISVKILFLILGVLGLMSMWGAVFSDVGVTLIAVLNSLRMLKK
jgi:Cd2+/Zn2+-exporting ATPase